MGSVIYYLVFWFFYTVILCSRINFDGIFGFFHHVPGFYCTFNTFWLRWWSISNWFMWWSNSSSLCSAISSLDHLLHFDYFHFFYSLRIVFNVRHLFWLQECFDLSNCQRTVVPRLASVMFFKGLKYLDAGTAGIIGLTEIFFGYLFGIVLFGEDVKMLSLIGSMIILIAAAYPILHSR